MCKDHDALLIHSWSPLSAKKTITKCHLHVESNAALLLAVIGLYEEIPFGMVCDEFLSSFIFAIRTWMINPATALVIPANNRCWVYAIRKRVNITSLRSSISLTHSPEG